MSGAKQKTWITSTWGKSDAGDSLNENYLYHPLLNVNFINDQDINLKLSKAKAVILSSRNGVIGAINSGISEKLLHGVDFFVVGKKTSDLLTSRYPAINNNKISVFLSAMDLFNTVNYSKDTLYIRGETVTIDPSLLDKNQISSSIVYQTIPMETLPEDILLKIKNREINTISIYSKRAAEAMVDLIYFYQLFDYFKSIKLDFLSKEIENHFSCTYIELENRSGYKAKNS